MDLKLYLYRGKQVKGDTIISLIDGLKEFLSTYLNINLYMNE